MIDETMQNALKQTLDPRLIATRKGGGDKVLSYIEAHDAIDQANRIFGYGNWGYDILSCEQIVLHDPLSGEACGVMYQVTLRLKIQDCQPITDGGSATVTAWSVRRQVMRKRVQAAKYAKTTAQPIEEHPADDYEASQAEIAIAESHDMARKSAMTDALKRALRCYGNQFGNGLYGDGKQELDEEPTAVQERPVGKRVAQTPAPAPQPLSAIQIEILEKLMRECGKTPKAGWHEKRTASEYVSLKTDLDAAVVEYKQKAEEMQAEQPALVA